MSLVNLDWEKKAHFTSVFERVAEVKSEEEKTRIGYYYWIYCTY
jgi:hypothetical protein